MFHFYLLAHPAPLPDPLIYLFPLLFRDQHGGCCCITLPCNVPLHRQALAWSPSLPQINFLLHIAVARRFLPLFAHNFSFCVILSKATNFSLYFELFLGHVCTHLVNPTHHEEDRNYSQTTILIKYNLKGYNNRATKKYCYIQVR